MTARPRRPIEVCFGRTHAHGHSKALHDLARMVAHHVQADHALARALHDQLEQGALLTRSRRMLERAEVALVDIDLGIALPRRLLAQAHRAHVRLSEDGSGHQIVVQRSRLLREQAAHDRFAFRNGHRCQLTVRGRVAHCVDMLDARSGARVDAHGAAFVQLHASLFEPEAARSRLSADREQHLIDLEHAPSSSTSERACARL